VAVVAASFHRGAAGLRCFETTVVESRTGRPINTDYHSSGRIVYFGPG
jgi:hypothetical protein